MELFGPQPDFEVLSKNYSEMAISNSILADQFKRFPNLPSLQNGQQILDKLDVLQQAILTLTQQLAGVITRLDGIDARLDRMDARFDGIDARFEKMEQNFATRIAASESNSISRLQNVRCTLPNDQLVPLYAVATNTAIEDFPLRLADIDRLDAQRLNNLFSLLGHTPPANIHHKRRDFKRLVGVINQNLHD
ncbi:hypothetical protein F4803DRAFT_515099 [Xylaria telfairii]|nr:hypothetical protein F4803DRAFT_515099 [Xylaria telfairii]